MTERLLADVTAINNKYSLINQKTGAYFNIFNITGISQDEVAICKLICELLDYRGSHSQDDAYLRLFVTEVLGLDFSELDYITARVIREHSSYRRRIDFVIIALNYTIPIEVKIFANDQDGQCSDYVRAGKNSDLYFLTLDGRLPSENSASSLKPVTDESGEVIGYEKVRLISFGFHIVNWINKCLALPETVRIAPIREILLQFKDVVLGLVGKKEGGEKMEIVETIMLSPDTIKSALDIEKAMPEVKSSIMKNTLRELKRLFEENGHTVIGYDEQTVDDYYTSRTKTFPGFSVEVTRIDNIALVIYVEIDWYFVFGFSLAEVQNKEQSHEYWDNATFKKKESKKYGIFTSAVAEVMGKGKSTDYSVYWDFIVNDKSEQFNFKTFSESCVDLLKNHESQTKHIFDILHSRLCNVRTVCKMKMEGLL